MPPRRKRAATEDKNNDDAKKVCPNQDLSGQSFRWEWEGDGGKWVVYSDEHASTLTDAYSGNSNQVKLNVGNNVQMVVVFDRMIQRNAKTGWERRLRCCVQDEGDSEYYAWQWEDEHGRWNPYQAKAALRLELAKQEGDDSIELDIFNRSYTFDLTSMQQVNNDTEVARSMQRVKSEAANPSASVVPSKISSGAKASTSAAASGSSKGKGKRTAASSGGSKSAGKKVKVEDEDAEDESSDVKTVVVKGKAPVDPECKAKAGVAHVYCEGKDIYDVMLNQTNLQNNNNKYYLIQLLQDDNKKAFSVWQRWGRVGFKGQCNLVPCGPDLEEAKEVFCKKFSDKTKNDWSLRTNFKKVPGKYDMVALDYGTEEEEAKSAKKKTTNGEKSKIPDSKLDTRLQDLINLICNVQAMEDAVVEMKYDAKKAPLGKLTAEQIKAGYAALKKIDTCIGKDDFGQKLVQACDEFYTRIPHYFGMSRPPVIRTKKEVKAKLTLLEALGDIEIAMKILKHSQADENPVDTHYKDLKCEMQPLDRADADFTMVQDYVKTTHASTHNNYKMKVLDVFSLAKENEEENFKDVGNKMLLWHGSRLTNWVGILSTGLRIAPPEAPVTGYMFGKGVYFADMSSKSANYCFTSKSKNIGLVLLSEVALGNTNDLLAADYDADKLPKGKDSVKGLGRIAPDPSKYFTMPNGTVVPIGKGKDTGVNNPNGYTLNYNEFVVYDTRQIKMKYLVKVQFDFK